MTNKYSPIPMLKNSIHCRTMFVDILILMSVCTAESVVYQMNASEVCDSDHDPVPDTVIPDPESNPVPSMVHPVPTDRTVQYSIFVQYMPY
ncbi:hypothetical protein T310_0081 [Rasamsonia emersonii CBS 393.64]|uniref:Uncharacterized protein n=1 Tax=Rasamsonia emersonii (strain ATCC 16479 / CBS 393.64 / IMI 116815) TaxID=1408163 RepID=A0A0F4Z7P6_RASE3|nr:hypothetical protein T310_0081 [Rasamsonia emersonii CBS 393.64]KKA25878.1 hypothetical protein T310_0081 [Rasamsonia emersonii CBS 393.64]